VHALFAHLGRLAWYLCTSIRVADFPQPQSLSQWAGREVVAGWATCTLPCTIAVSHR
jgi:hypothetical protein